MAEAGDEDGRWCGTVKRLAEACLGRVEGVVKLPPALEIFERANCLTAPLVFVLSFVAAFVYVLGIGLEGAPPVKGLLFQPQSGAFRHELAVATANSFAILAGIIGITFGYVALLHFRCGRAVLVFTFITLVSVAALFVGWLIYTLSKTCHIPFDWITLCLFAWNMACIVCCFVLFEKTRNIFLHKVCILLCAATLSWPLCCLPEMTLWLLIVLVVVWDIVAVMTPCGPLRYAVRLMQERVYMGETVELPDGMVYEGSLYHLGFGDIVFYCVVVGRAASVSFQATIACIVGVVSGLMLTVLVTPDDKTIPALPITITISLIVYFLMRFLVMDYVNSVWGFMI
mmetsp:Transcript_3904/g.5678  ORF Transcript_3904/g.5678 Transcript_3904/m.5678 type:complete len:342 (+) Transcript_3904:387-1412(+)|eukprot:CAMPEP_0203773706 /NCGR_PEP_ID=MMETSP0099_2-20121227/4816_1 /ASSEMBLY_ACC=CAM_ASM_000209 /TAXON_ID=96639 /ORGANISM=" , Strain NY0313808BC1" /LENGTH=341 /DNA_ID=CAMNT_0050671585 /DNA_START=253 /DNA_END=1278 /DNA_ORIENTATION=-